MIVAGFTNNIFWDKNIRLSDTDTILKSSHETKSLFFNTLKPAKLVSSHNYETKWFFAISPHEREHVLPSFLQAKTVCQLLQT